LFLYLFIAAPTVIWMVGLSRSWIVLVLGLVFLTGAISIRFHKLHSYFFPNATDERFTQVLILFLSPVTAIRALDLLSRHLLEQFHPLAVAKVLCAEPEFRALARELLREIRHPALPVCPNQQPEAVRAEMETRALLLAGMEDLLKKAGVLPAELLQPPVPLDQTCVAYCPRCLTQFTSATGRCNDCGDMPLIAFAKPSKKS
jgi:hypothetical protein